MGRLGCSPAIERRGSWNVTLILSVNTRWTDRQQQRHSREGGNPDDIPQASADVPWMPAFAGTTDPKRTK